MAGEPTQHSLNGRSARSTPQRIALFTGAYNHIADGVSLTLNRLVAHLESQGAEVLIFAPTVNHPAVDHAGTLVPVPSFPLMGRTEYRVSLGLKASIRKRLHAFQPTLIHIATPDYLGLSALRLAHKWGVPVVASYHTHFTSYLKYYPIGFLESPIWHYLRWFYSKCKHVYVPTDSMAKVLRRHGIDSGLRLWQRGVDTEHFSPKRRSLAWRRTLGIGDDEVVVAFVSRLVWEKGPDVFADVIEALQARGIPHRSLIVGDGPIRAELEERLPDTLFTGHLEDDALARAYASSDVFLFPSETETFGNVTLEAMASGLPTVCADATGSRSLVQPNETGFLATPGDRPQFIDQVERLITNHRLRETMGQQARRHANEYDWDTILNRMVDYYDEILNPELAEAASTKRVDRPVPDFSLSDSILVAPSEMPVTP